VKDYWKKDPDAQIDTGGNIFRYYREAGKLQISKPTWKDRDGNEKPGKTLTIDLDSLREADGGLEFLQHILDEIA